nr:hypothetical protein [Tanacetum cinerariifolium]
MEEDIPPVAAPYTELSLTSPPSLLKSSSDSDTAAPITVDRNAWVPPYGITFEQSLRTHQSEIGTNRIGIGRLGRRMDAYDVDLGFIERDATRTSDQVLAPEEENRRLRRRVDSLEVNNTLASMIQDRVERERERVFQLAYTGD